METEPQKNADPLGPLLVRLLKGPLTSDHQPNIWSSLLLNRHAAEDYFSRIGLEILVDEEEGFAFLRQRDPGDSEEFPRLIGRRALSFPLSLLCALLRKKLLEFDTYEAGARAIIGREDIYQMMSVFLPDSSNERSLRGEIDRHIGKAEEIGILSAVPGQEGKLEIRRVIKAMISAEWLSTLDQKLEQYREHGKSDA